MPNSALKSWRGVGGTLLEAIDGRPVLTDYERACQCTGYIDTIPLLDGAQGLVVGDVPLDTSVWTDRLGHPVIVGVEYCEPGIDERSYLAALKEGPFDKPVSVLPFRMSGPDLVIFEAAHPAAMVDERLDVRMAPGAYCVLTAYWQPDSKTSFRLDKLAPIS